MLFSKDCEDLWYCRSIILCNTYVCFLSNPFMPGAFPDAPLGPFACPAATAFSIHFLLVRLVKGTPTPLITVKGNCGLEDLVEHILPTFLPFPEDQHQTFSGREGVTPLGQHTKSY